MEIEPSMVSGSPATLVEMRSPAPADGAAVWELVAATPSLDANSPYAYLLLCSHFAETGLVAHAEGRLVGFVLGYARPDDSATAFVWQVAVAADARGQGLAGRMLDVWFARCASRFGARFVEATVTPSNQASRRLFASFAERHAAPLRERLTFPRLLFPDVPGEAPHADEYGFRIGPFARPRTLAPHQETA